MAPLVSMLEIDINKPNLNMSTVVILSDINLYYRLKWTISADCLHNQSRAVHSIPASQKRTLLGTQSNTLGVHAYVIAYCLGLHSSSSCASKSTLTCTVSLKASHPKYSSSCILMTCFQALVAVVYFRKQERSSKICNYLITLSTQYYASSCFSATTKATMLKKYKVFALVATF